MTDVVPLYANPVHPESTSFPVLAIIHTFEIDDGRLKELIYHAGFWSVRSLWYPEDQSIFDQRVNSMMDVQKHMMELGYRPQDPQVLLHKLTENLNRCLVRDDSTDEEDMAKFDADMAMQRAEAESSTGIVRTKVAKILLDNSQSERYHLQSETFIPSDEMTLEDLGLDSLALVESALQIEEEMKISAPDDAILNCKTFGDVVKLVEQHG